MRGRSVNGMRRGVSVCVYNVRKVLVRCACGVYVGIVIGGSLVTN
jgi:hypothetical protein